MTKEDLLKRLGLKRTDAPIPELFFIVVISQAMISLCTVFVITSTGTLPPPAKVMFPYLGAFSIICPLLGLFVYTKPIGDTWKLHQIISIMPIFLVAFKTIQSLMEALP